MNSTTSVRPSNDDQEQLVNNRFAQIKAKFEQKPLSNVMASPLASTASSTHTTVTRESSGKQTDNSYTKQRRESNEAIPTHRMINDNKSSSSRSTGTENIYQRSQSMTSEKSKTSSFRRLESADEADEEVRQIHQQGNHYN